MDLKNRTTALLEEVRRSSPLIHNITNFVVMNSSANILLSLGASPVMAHCIEEVEEMTAMAGALVLNIGTVQHDWVDSMILAAQAANRRGVPVVLDPVGAGATKLRSAAVERIMKEARIDVLRGNASEVLSVGGSGEKTRGVDSTLGIGGDTVAAARAIARERGCVVGISGEVDIVTDGDRVLRVANGHPVMTRVTGTGCGLSAVTGAFCAVSEGDLLEATAAAFGFYALCGELAAAVSDNPGSFAVAFVDALHTTGRFEIEGLLRLTSE